MTPAGGVGANTALRDAAFLGRLLRQAGGWRESITEEYENEMRVYASEAVKMSFETAAKQFKITELK
jgi:2-polyprenyl-6-methoxyphenol hydroxylase-like FAD-dependent oxidoreductase